MAGCKNKKNQKLLSVSPLKVAAATGLQLVASMWDRVQGAAGLLSFPKKPKIQNFY